MRTGNGAVAPQEVGTRRNRRLTSATSLLLPPIRLEPLAHRASLVGPARAIGVASPGSIGIAARTRLVVLGDGPPRGISRRDEGRTADERGQSQGCKERFHARLPASNMP